MPLSWEREPRSEAVLSCPPAERGVISWNTHATSGSLAVRVRFADESWSEPLPYVRWSERERLSLGGRGERAHFDVDVLLSNVPFTAVEIQSSAKLDAVMLATPPPRTKRPRRGVKPKRAPQRKPSEPLEAIELDVPRLSQYVGDPGRGWCSPASLAMLLRAQGIDASVPGTARETYDGAYHGTGNWAFNVAYASSFGFRAFVAYLRGLAHARKFIDAGTPLAVSYAWTEGRLKGAPLPSSDGHVAVLRGFDARGNPILNDPAQPVIRTTYPRLQFERLWLAHGGVAYVIARLHAPTIEIANA